MVDFKEDIYININKGIYVRYQNKLLYMLTFKRNSSLLITPLMGIHLKRNVLKLKNILKIYVKAWKFLYAHLPCRLRL